MAENKWTVFTTNSDQGGAGNPAVTNFNYLNADIDDVGIAARLIGFFSYCNMATGSTVVGVSKGLAGGGGQLPIPFPTATYATLVAADSQLYPVTDYGQPMGSGFIAAAGTGAVIRRQTDTPGRSGRGRLTTPWLTQDAVDGFGRLSSAAQALLTAGFQNYVFDIVGGPGIVTPKLDSALGYLEITSFSVTPTLGRTRSRRQ